VDADSIKRLDRKAGGHRGAVPSTLVCGRWLARTIRDTCYHADPAVLLQHGGSHVLDGSHTAPAHRRVKFVECHALAGEVLVQDAPIVDEQGGCCFEQPRTRRERNVISATR
jgi:hypothetical protein